MAQGVQGMPMDWQAFSSIIGFAGIIIALMALLFETRRSRIALKTETLLTLDERMRSPDTKSLRKAAAKKILAGDLQNEELGRLAKPSPRPRSRLFGTAGLRSSG